MKAPELATENVGEPDKDGLEFQNVKLESKEAAGQEVTIERAKPEDAEAIMTLKRSAWLKAYVSPEHGITEEDLFAKFDLPTAIENWRGGIASEAQQSDKATFVARVHGRVVGYTSPDTQDGQKRIGALYVSPDEQKHGVGSKLLQRAITWHGRDDDIYLRVVSYNQNAIGFYEHFGFQKTGKEWAEEYDAEQGMKLLPEIEMVLRHV